VQDPPLVDLIDHPSPRGGLLAWRLNPDGSWDALISWVEVPNDRRPITRHEEWLPAARVRPIDGWDYSQVPRTKT
jgi:hypothetical protein